MTGESFLHDGTRFEVVDMDGRRVDKVLVQLQSTDDTGETLDL